MRLFFTMLAGLLSLSSCFSPAPCTRVPHGVSKRYVMQDRNKLVEEAKALSFSWQTARYGIYTVFGVGSLAGLAAAVQEGDVAGAVVDGLTVAASAAGAYIESSTAAKSGSKSAAASEARPPPVDWGAALDLKLTLMLSEKASRDVPLSDLTAGAAQTVVLLGGPSSWVRECLVSARFSSELFRAGDVLLVPVNLPSLEEEGAPAAATATAGKGFAKSQWVNAPYVAQLAEDDAAGFVERMEVESAAAAEQGADPSKGIVVVLRKGGEVRMRRLGTPDWRPFVTLLSPGRFDKLDVAKASKMVG